MLIFLYVILSLIVIYFITCFFIFRYIFARTKPLNWLDKQCLKGTYWEDFADNMPIMFKWVEDNNATEISFKTFDNLTLYGKFIKTENAKGTVILVHGYRGNFISDFGVALKMYKEFGFNILMYHARATEKSQGKYVTFGINEHKDLLSAISYHNSIYGEIPVFVSGISMGASTVMYAIDKNLPRNVKGMTADSGYSSPYDIIKKVIKDRLGFDGSFLLFGIDFWCRLLGKFHLKECNIMKTLKNAKVPIIFVHGKSDDFVPYTMTENGYMVCSSEKQLFLVDGAGHGTSFIKEQEMLTKALEDFFAKHLN